VKEQNRRKKKMMKGSHHSEEAIEKTIINITTANEYEKLLEIHSELWKLLYFKIHQEESYLLVK
jgi:hypothetical protein